MFPVCGALRCARNSQVLGMQRAVGPAPSWLVLTGSSASVSSRETCLEPAPHTCTVVVPPGVSSLIHVCPYASLEAPCTQGLACCVRCPPYRRVARCALGSQ